MISSTNRNEGNDVISVTFSLRDALRKITLWLSKGIFLILEYTENSNKEKLQNNHRDGNLTTVTDSSRQTNTKQIILIFDPHISDWSMHFNQFDTLNTNMCI